jgi:hypothetical protein
MSDLDAELSGDDGLYESHTEIIDIWRVVALSKDDLQAEIEDMGADHPHHAPMTEVVKHLNAALEVLTPCCSASG